MSYECDTCPKQYESYSKFIQHKNRCNNRVETRRSETRSMSNPRRDLERENLVLRSKVRKLESSVEIDEDIKTQYTRDLAQKNVTIAEMEQKLTQAQKEAEVIRHTQVTALQKQLEKLETESRQNATKIQNTHKLEIQKLETNLQQVKQDWQTQLRKEKVSSSTLRMQALTEQQTRHDSENKVLAKSHLKEINQLETKYNSAEINVRHLRTLLENSTSQLETAKSELAQVRDNFRKEYQALSNANSNTIKMQKNQLEDAVQQIRTLKREVPEQMNTIHKLQKERNDLQKQYDIDMSNYQNKVRNLSTQVQTSKQLLEQSTTEIKTDYELKLKKLRLEL